MGAEEKAKAFAQLNSELQVTEEGKGIEAFITRNKNLNVGDKFVDFNQPDINGEMVQLSKLIGRYILIGVWASWCSPCRSFYPELVEQ